MTATTITDLTLTPTPTPMATEQALPADWEVVEPPPHPQADLDEQLQATARRCRRLATKRSLLAAGVAMIPVPGLDWLTDIGVLVKLLPEINAAFGLTPSQIERLAPDRKVVVYKALSAGGTLLVGRVVTRELVIKVLAMVGMRLTTQQAAKYVPIAGQAVSAALTFSALKYVCEQHIRQCAAVARQLQLPPPSQRA